jgi:hypothetical protein
VLVLASSTTDGAAAAGLSIVFLLFVAVGVVFYFVPTIIAFVRNKSNKLAILALNAFLGWSLVGWVVSLVWALSKDQQPVIIQQTFNGPPATEPLAYAPPAGSSVPPPAAPGTNPIP